MPSVILSINAGSSSLKCAVHDMDDAEMAVLNATVSGLADKPRLVLKQVGAPETVHEELPDT
ncbi:MAG: acetate/propionate family kinase, partial [Phenylobacterium sp.]|nr:acetate/propionate family kinase [Phenylobacterium sp.]